MKKIFVLLTVLVLTIAAEAQTLKVTTDNGVYQYPATNITESSPALFTDGTTLTIANDVFDISDITEISVVSGSSSSVEDNTVDIVYNGSTATVTMADNVTQYVSATVSGAHVTITQSNTADVDGDEITYVLSGTTTDGSLTLNGSYKCTVSLAGVTLTNPSGPAINIGNKKRIQLSAKNGTENTLTDGADANESWKGCIYSKGQLQLQGKGSLTVNGNTKHAIKSGDYITVKNLTLNVKSTVGDGISCNKYFVMNSGTVTISGAGDDGIQCDLEEDDDTTGETTDHEDENSGNIYIEGGTLTIATTALGSKGVKATGTLAINETSSATVVYITNTGGVDASDSSDLAGSACLKSDAAINISGGTLTLTNSGQGGRAINCDGTLTISGGTIDAKAQGSNYGSSGGGGPWGGSSSNHKYAKGVKADGNITISGGTLNAYSKNHEGLESKGTITISGGEVYAEASDDAINAASHMTISGGYVCGYSTGNDGLDSNGNMYIQGGVVYAIGSGSPEVAIDANTEGGYKLYVTGGTIITIGGLESGSSLSQSCYQASSWSKNTWYAMTVGSETIAFKTPSSGGSGLVVSGASQPTLKSGVTVSNGTSIFSGMGYTNATVSGGSSVTLSSYSGGSSGGPGGGGPGGGGWH